MKQLLIKIVFGILRLWTMIVPAGFDKALVVFLAKARSNNLPPNEGLKFLFEIDYGLYTQQKIIAAKYEGNVGLKYRLMQYHMFFIENITDGERVLDLGCGTGRLSYEIATHHDVEIVGIDLKESWLTLAKTEHAHPNIRYVYGDVLKDLPDETFDVVVMSNVLEHIPPNRSEFLRQVQQITHAKHFLIRVPMFDREWRVPLKKEVGATWTLDPDHKTEFTLESFREEITAAGLTIKSHYVQWSELYAVLEAQNATD